MKPRHSLSLLVVSLCFPHVVRCDDIVITTRPRWQYGDINTIDIKFSLQLFKNFYECLCKATTQQCSVNLSYSWSRFYAANVHRYDYHVQPNKENLSCKYYKCSYNYSYTFICTSEESQSLGSSPRIQSMQYRIANCGDTKCVSILWEFREEIVDYSSVQSTVFSCNNTCGGLTRAPIWPTTIRTTTETPHTNTTKRKTSLTSKQTTTTEIQKTSQAEATPQTTGTLNAGKQTTIQEIGDNTITNATASGVVSNSRKHDPIPIIAGVVAASILVASIAAVVIFLWKRKKSVAQKPASDCHEYANLPSASGRVKGVGTSNAVNLSQDLSSQFNNYETVNASFDYDLAQAKYATPTNKSNDNTVQTDNQPYVSCEPSKISAVAPKECNQTREASTAITDGYVTVTNTLEETDDFTNSIYELAHHCPGTVTGLAGASIPNTETNLHDLYSENRTKEPSSNDTGAAVTTKLHANKDNTYVNDTSYCADNTNTEPRIDLQNLKEARNYLHDYESAKPAKESVSITDTIYSVSNDDVDSETTYSIAANPAKHTDNCARPHVYAHLGKETHNIVNPYNILQQGNEPPVPLLAKLQNINLGKSSDTIQPYSLAEPIDEYQPRSDNDNLYQAIDSTDDDDDEQCTDTYTTPYVNATRGISAELFKKSNNASGCQVLNDNIYFELEK